MTSPRFNLKSFFLYLLPFVVGLLVTSCDAAGGSGHDSVPGDTIPLRYAQNLSIVRYDGFTKVTLRNPWDSLKTLATYILIPRDSVIPQNLPHGDIIRVPIQRAVVYPSAHIALAEEMGALDQIVGACDVKYITADSAASRVAQLRIADCGSTMSPNIEKILSLTPDAILVSAFENSNDHNKVAQLNIPVIDCADYMEASPLARAEWVRFFGRLFGKDQFADSLFLEVESRYIALKQAAANVENKPRVLTEMIYGGVWDVPAANSTIGRLIEDAGAVNPFAQYKRSGSVRLSPEEVFLKAGDADFWLIKYAAPKPLSLSDLASQNDIYPRLNAFKQNRVYGINCNFTSYFDQTPFHPERILAEYISIFHPQIPVSLDQQPFYSLIQP